MTPDSRYYKIEPPPASTDELQADDLVYLTYDLYQWGTWFIALQVGKLETKLEEDGRFELMAYEYDDEAGKITFEVRVRAKGELPPKLQTAGLSQAAYVLIGIVGTVIVYFAYDRTRKAEFYRRGVAAGKQGAIEAIDSNPDLTPAQKDSAKAAIEKSLPRIADKEAWWTPFVWLGVGLVILAVVGTRK